MGERNFIVSYTEISPATGENNSLGAGAFGRVYRAKWRGREVAVKESANSTFDESFRAEAAVIQSLVPHPNVVLFLFMCEKPFCLGFELCKGGSLLSQLFRPDPQIMANSALVSKLSKREREHIDDSNPLQIPPAFYLKWIHDVSCGMLHLS